MVKEDLELAFQLYKENNKNLRKVHKALQEKGIKFSYPSLSRYKIKYNWDEEIRLELQNKLLKEARKAVSSEETKKTLTEYKKQENNLSISHRMDQLLIYNYSAIVESLTTRLKELKDKKTLSTIESKELRDMAFVMKECNALKKDLIDKSLPSPNGYIDLNEVGRLFNNTYKYILEKIARRYSIAEQDRMNLCDEIRNYGILQIENFNKRKDIKIISNKEANEIVMEEYKNAIDIKE